MGFADVIPGVSGGTMALILGIYVEFIEALKSINLRFLRPLFGWIGSGFKKTKLDELKEALNTIHIAFLVFLGGGIVVAFGIGSKIIPDLLDRYPVEMRAFFFGLITASVWIPYKMMKKHGRGEAIAAALFLAAAFFLVGLSADLIQSWELEEVTAEGETMEAIALAVPSALTPSQILGLPENQEALQSIAASYDMEPSDLAALAASHDPRHTRVNEMVAPAGIVLHIPRPPLWWIFLCGIIAICAMVLPGVSGSFLLLALSTYFFMLNALKGFISGMIHLSPSPSSVAFVAVFITGAMIGLVTFSRVLSYLFRRWPNRTLAAMAGLMIGSLRRIWPFQSDGVNHLPAELSSTVLIAIGAFVAGAVIVLVLDRIGNSGDLEMPS
jgi:putative membrane protein